MANSSSRNGARVLWVTVHTAEGIRKASDLKAFFERSTNSSAHAVADDSTLLDNLVPYDRAAWTLRNGNTRSDNLELCGFASWSRAEWINNHQGMLNNAAAWVRSRCHARGIPIRKLSPAQVAAGMNGVIGHVDYTNATGDGTHWDPGPGFPWDIVIARANNEENDMQLTDHVKLFDGTSPELQQVLAGIITRLADPVIESARFPGHKDTLAGFISAIDGNVLGLADGIKALTAAQQQTNAKLDKVIELLTPKTVTVK